MRRGWRGRRRKENKDCWSRAALDPAGMRRNMEEVRFLQHHPHHSQSTREHAHAGSAPTPHHPLNMHTLGRHPHLVTYEHTCWVSTHTLSPHEHVCSVGAHISSLTCWEHRPVLSTLTLANIKTLLCISCWISVTGTAETSFCHLPSPPSLSGCAAFSLPSGELNLRHSSMNTSSTLAAATGIGITKVLENQKKTNNA